MSAVLTMASAATGSSATTNVTAKGTANNPTNGSHGSGISHVAGSDAPSVISPVVVRQTDIDTQESCVNYGRSLSRRRSISRVPLLFSCTLLGGFSRSHWQCIPLCQRICAGRSVVCLSETNAC
jgi:hypothetical protein